MSKIQFSFDTFKQYTRNQQSKIIKLAESMLDNSFDIDIISSLPNDGFLIRKGSAKIAVDGKIISDFVVNRVGGYTWDEFEHWVTMWQKDTEIAYYIALLIECDRIACQLVKIDPIQRFPTQPTNDAPKIWESAPWPKEADERVYLN